MLEALPEIDFTLQKVIECASCTNSINEIESFIRIYGVCDKETFTDLVLHYKGSLQNA